MSSLDIAVACALLAVATLIFVFGIRVEPSDSVPHRTKLDQLLERRDAIEQRVQSRQLVAGAEHRRRYLADNILRRARVRH